MLFFSDEDWLHAVTPKLVHEGVISWNCQRKTAPDGVKQERKKFSQLITIGKRDLTQLQWKNNLRAFLSLVVI